jgi:hypothetical protein
VRSIRALAHGELVDIRRARMVIILREPVFQLGVPGRVVRTHIFDVEHMAHEPLVADLGGELVCFRKTPALHRCEELAIGFAVGTAQYFGAPDARCALAACIRNEHFAPGHIGIRRSAEREKQRGCHGNRTNSPARRTRGERMKCPPFHGGILPREPD